MKGKTYLRVVGLNLLCRTHANSALQTYLKGESVLEVPGGSLFRGAGLGTWERLDDHDFAAHFKFFLFKADGSGGPRSRCAMAGAGAHAYP